MHWAPKFRHGQRGNCFFRMSEMTRAQLQSYLAGVPGEQLIHLNPFALLMVVVAHPDLNVHGEDSVSRLVPSLLT